MLPEGIDKLMEDFVETTSYDEPGDWQNCPATDEDPDDTVLATDEAAGHEFRGNQYTAGASGDHPKPGKGGVKSLAVSLLKEGKMSHAQIAQHIQKTMGTNTSKECIDWYASQEKKNSPEGKAAAAAKAEGQKENNEKLEAIKAAYVKAGGYAPPTPPSAEEQGFGSKNAAAQEAATKAAVLSGIKEHGDKITAVGKPDPIEKMNGVVALGLAAKAAQANFVKANPGIHNSVLEAHAEMLASKVEVAVAMQKVAAADDKGKSAAEYELEVTKETSKIADKAFASAIQDHAPEKGLYLLTSATKEAKAAVMNAAAFQNADKYKGETKITEPGHAVNIAIIHEGVPLTHGELDAIHGYTDGEYSDLNHDLREGNSLTETRLTLAANLDSALAKGDIKGGTYYRGIDGTVATKMFGPEINIGDSVTDKGFISTSKSQAKAHEFSHGGVILEITADKGMHGMDVTAISSVGKEEKEVILPRGSKFTVTGVRTPTSNNAPLVIKLHYGEKK